MPRRPQQLELTWYNKNRALIPTEHGKYGYTWVQPTDPRYCETRRLIIDDEYTGQQSPKDDSLDYSGRADLPPQTDNLLIRGESGDVLEALTRVPELKVKYAGQVKCIYIDPPFNTGDAFAHYDDNLEHSVWLTMMRDRLENLKTMLSADGSIWVHLDDNECHRMRVLLDEIFGPASFKGTVVWEKSPGSKGDTDIAASHDYIHIYAPHSPDWKLVRNKLPRSTKQLGRYSNPDGDPRGPWRQGADGTAKSGNDTLRFEVTTPSGRIVTPPAGNYWRFTQETLAKAREEKRVWFGVNGDSLPVIKTYLSNVVEGVVPNTWWTNSEVGSNQEAKRDHLRRMFPDSPKLFDTPKPERLLERIIHIATDPGDLVLDVFAGSGTTAAVAQKMGRRWVASELQDHVFDEFTLPRLRKVIANEDPDGITSVKKDRVPVEGVTLPESISPEDAHTLTRLLAKAHKSDSTLIGVDELSSIRERLATELVPTLINWRGGGGFRTAHLSPVCFDYNLELGIVTLTEAAENINTLIGAVAAHCGYRLTPGEYFHGISGRSRLLVTRTPVDTEFVTEVAAHLDDRDTMTIASTVVLDGARAAVRKARRGSRILHIPHDLFTVMEDDDR
ncbi:site-specific DNA-methyltransferase [Brevibacterium sp. FAM 27836]|uniref:site-specific DNA-methyltransferase n=1 Tax=Brevibacterium sp. FAM 27836 TaxID=3446693 RepID=UPI003F510760